MGILMHFVNRFTGLLRLHVVL